MQPVAIPEAEHGVAGAECTGWSAPDDTSIRVSLPGQDVEQVELWVSEIGWALGAGYMYRWHRPPRAETHAGLRHDMGAEIMPLDGMPDILIDSGDVLRLAAKRGYWTWEINAAYGHTKSTNIYIDKWREHDPTLRDDGGRDTLFPGWDGYHPFLRATEPGTGYESHYFFSAPKRWERGAVYVRGLKKGGGGK